MPIRALTRWNDKMRLLSQFMLALALTAGSIIAYASEHEAGSLKAEHAWARVTIEGRPGAGYLVIHNMGGDADRLVSASSPMVERIELHTHVMKDNVMKMRRVDGFDVPAGGQVKLEPGGNHLMLFGFKHHPKANDKLPVTLVFEKAGSLELMLVVKGAGDRMKDDHDDHSGHSDNKDEADRGSHSD